MKICRENYLFDTNTAHISIAQSFFLSKKITWFHTLKKKKKNLFLLSFDKNEMQQEFISLSLWRQFKKLVFSSHLFVFQFSFHALKEEKVLEKNLFQKQAVVNCAALLSGNVTVVQVYNIMQIRKKKKKATEAATLSLWSLFFHIFLMVRWILQWPLMSTYIRDRISTLSPSTALIPHCWWSCRSHTF